MVWVKVFATEGLARWYHNTNLKRVFEKEQACIVASRLVVQCICHWHHAHSVCGVVGEAVCHHHGGHAVVMLQRAYWARVHVCMCAHVCVHVCVCACVHARIHQDILSYPNYMSNRCRNVHRAREENHLHCLHRGCWCRKYCLTDRQATTAYTPKCPGQARASTHTYPWTPTYAFALAAHTIGIKQVRVGIDYRGRQFLILGLHHEHVRLH